MRASHEAGLRQLVCINWGGSGTTYPWHVDKHGGREAGGILQQAKHGYMTLSWVLISTNQRAPVSAAVHRGRAIRGHAWVCCLTWALRWCSSMSGSSAMIWEHTPDSLSRPRMPSIITNAPPEQDGQGQHAAWRPRRTIEYTEPAAHSLTVGCCCCCAART
jgi:hypothetical protein